jgi:biotin-dependent carboxylase-like uncharacterized protein
MKVFRVVAPGAYTTIQDLGRIGYQRLGVPLSGALDGYASQVANLLLGNDPGAAVLEMTIVGPQLEFMAETKIAVTGARMGLHLNNTAIEGWCALRVKPGDRLEINQVIEGCRSYLAVAGGVDVPVVMGSRSTYVGGGLGGFKGRSLKSGDIIASGPARLSATPLKLPEKWKPVYADPVRLRVVPGPQDDFFDEGLDTLISGQYMVTAKADRMGYRLQGPPVVPKPRMPKSIISEPSMPGGIQIPADQQPIVLFVEQTVGGYTKIATVVSRDLPALAQAVPGDAVQFEAVSLETAHSLYHDHHDTLRAIAEWVTKRTS